VEAVVSEEPSPSYITGNNRSLGLTSHTSLDRSDLLRVLGRGLRQLYTPVVQEGVPHDLMPLIKALRPLKEDAGPPT